MHALIVKVHVLVFGSVCAVPVFVGEGCVHVSEVCLTASEYSMLSQLESHYSSNVLAYIDLAQHWKFWQVFPSIMH